jgi:hypothetical protein
MLTESAIKKNGKVYTGKRHCNILNDPVRPKGFFRGSVQGFITAGGEFLNRKEAKKHAFDCGQIEKTISKDLTSEDLW